MERILQMATRKADGEPGWAQRLGAWLRRLVTAPAAGDLPLRVEARLSLGAKRSLVLVNCCGRQVLLAVNSDAITTVLEMPKPSRSAGNGRRKEAVR
jgi:flagellar biogenesis protein FliO